MLKRLTIAAAFAALTLLAAAPLAIAQNADQNTAGPTRNDLKLRLTEPREGQQISGTSIRIAIDYNRTIFGAGTGTHFGDKNFPHPIFDVYVDNALKQSLKGGDANVAQIDDVPLGNHKVVVVAKNISGEVIDRAQVNVVNIEAAGATTTSSAPAATAETAPPPAPQPAPVAPAPAPPAPAYSSSEPPSTSSSSTLPATASSAPVAALLGMTLLGVAGALRIRRKAR